MSLFYDGDLLPCWGGREFGKVDGGLRTCYVVNLQKYNVLIPNSHLKNPRQRLTLMARREMQAPWSLKAKYTPFLVTGMLFTSVLMFTSELVLNLPSPAAIRPAKQRKIQAPPQNKMVECCLHIHIHIVIDNLKRHYDSGHGKNAFSR